MTLQSQHFGLNLSQPLGELPQCEWLANGAQRQSEEHSCWMSHHQRKTTRFQQHKLRPCGTMGLFPWVSEAMGLLEAKRLAWVATVSLRGHTLHPSNPELLLWET